MKCCDARAGKGILVFHNLYTSLAFGYKYGYTTVQQTVIVHLDDSRPGKHYMQYYCARIAILYTACASHTVITIQRDCRGTGYRRGLNNVTLDKVTQLTCMYQHRKLALPTCQVRYNKLPTCQVRDLYMYMH